MANGYRCTTCGNTYPHHDDYKTCPICDEACWAASNMEPMDGNEAKRIKYDAGEQSPGKRFTACSICAHEIHSAACPHPWHLTFTSWPTPMLDRLRAMVQNATPN